MFWNKKQTIWVHYKEVFYELDKEKKKSSLSSKDRKESIVIDFPTSRVHLLKYDSSQKIHHKFVINQKEYGISANELTIPYILDFVYYKNEMKFNNILLKTNFFSMCLIDTKNYLLIEHSKEEGNNPEFFSPVFNFEEFLIIDYKDATKNILTNMKKDIISVVIFLGMMYFAYEMIFAEEEKVKVKKVEKVELVMNDFQEELFMRYKQRLLLDKIEDIYSTNDFYENMFSYISNITIDSQKDIYTFTQVAAFNMMDKGYIKEGDTYTKTTDLKYLNKDNVYKKFTKDIINNEKKYYNNLWTGYNQNDVFGQYTNNSPYNSLILNKYIKKYYSDFKDKFIAERNDDIYKRLTNLFKSLGLEADKIDLKNSYFKYSGIWDIKKINKFLNIIKFNNIFLKYLIVTVNNSNNIKDITYNVNFSFILKNKINNDYNIDKDN